MDLSSGLCSYHLYVSSSLWHTLPSDACVLFPKHIKINTNKPVIAKTTGSAITLAYILLYTVRQGRYFFIFSNSPENTSTVSLSMRDSHSRYRSSRSVSSTPSSASRNRSSINDLSPFILLYIISLSLGPNYTTEYDQHRPPPSLLSGSTHLAADARILPGNSRGSSPDGRKLYPLFPASY